MAISSGFLLPLVLLFGIFIALINIHVKDPRLQGFMRDINQV
ncbi:hypothetical protein [Bacillus sp. ISL-75]|nr:hypothetical protein [Bacillus sp. ISL-75]